jgi:hypothetical protein
MATAEVGIRANAVEMNPDWWMYGREFPHWHVWRGVNGNLYARVPGVSPQRLVRAQTPEDLRDGIIRQEMSRWRVSSHNDFRDHCA